MSNIAPAQDAAKSMTAAEVMQRIIAATGATPPANTVDTLKAGDPSTIVTGIVTTFMDTYAVLQQAVASGDNLILYSQPRPLVNLNKAEGWTPESILAEAFPQMQDKFFPLMRAPLQPQPAAEPAKA